MASRIMHYIIGDKVADNIKVKDYNRFMFGNLSPDMSSHEDGSYSIFHIGGESTNLKGIDFHKFYTENITDIQRDDFLLGYFSHLLSDAIWLKTVKQQQIRKYDKIEKERRQKLGYKEMWLYNSVLLDIYPTEFKLYNESNTPIFLMRNILKLILKK